LICPQSSQAYFPYFSESGVTDSQILGVLEYVIRDGKRIEPADDGYIEKLEKHHKGRLLKGVKLEFKRRINR
jgi:hypothetical protein